MDLKQPDRPEADLDDGWDLPSRPANEPPAREPQAQAPTAARASSQPERPLSSWPPNPAPGATEEVDSGWDEIPSAPALPAPARPLPAAGQPLVARQARPTMFRPSPERARPAPATFPATPKPATRPIPAEPVLNPRAALAERKRKAGRVHKKSRARAAKTPEQRAERAKKRAVKSAERRRQRREAAEEANRAANPPRSPSSATRQDRSRPRAAADDPGAAAPTSQPQPREPAAPRSSVRRQRSESLELVGALRGADHGGRRSRRTRDEASETPIESAQKSNGIIVVIVVAVALAIVILLATVH